MTSIPPSAPHAVTFISAMALLISGAAPCVRIFSLSEDDSSMRAMERAPGVAPQMRVRTSERQHSEAVMAYIATGMDVYLSVEGGWLSVWVHGPTAEA